MPQARLCWSQDSFPFFLDRPRRQPPDQPQLIAGRLAAAQVLVPERQPVVQVADRNLRPDLLQPEGLEHRRK